MMDSRLETITLIESVAREHKTLEKLFRQFAAGTERAFLAEADYRVTARVIDTPPSIELQYAGRCVLLVFSCLLSVDEGRLDGVVTAFQTPRFPEADHTQIGSFTFTRGGQTNVVLEPEKRVV